MKALFYRIIIELDIILEYNFSKEVEINDKKPN